MTARDSLSLGQIRLFIRSHPGALPNLLLTALGLDEFSFRGIEVLGGFGISLAMIGRRWLRHECAPVQGECDGMEAGSYTHAAPASGAWVQVL
jgi:hypothetical protein